MTCKLMKRLNDIDGIENLSYESIENIKRLICGGHNGVCNEKYSDIKDRAECRLKDLCKYSNTNTCSKCLRNLNVFRPKDYYEDK